MITISADAHTSLCHFYHTQRGPAALHLTPPQRQLPAHGTAVLADAVLFPAPSRHVPLVPRDPKLLPVPHGRPALQPAVVRALMAQDARDAVGLHGDAEPGGPHGRSGDVVGLLVGRVDGRGQHW